MVGEPGRTIAERLPFIILTFRTKCGEVFMRIGISRSFDTNAFPLENVFGIAF